MRRLAILATGFWMVLGTIAAAQSQPVVVELYTSQGCSSCPPADEFLGKLANRNDVIALSLHVDYWDYIGWKDVFAKPQFTARQHAYAKAAGKRMVYTPQMVIAGQNSVVGTKPAEVERLIKTHRAAPARVDIKAVRMGNKVQITAKPLEKGLGEMVVQMVRYKRGQSVRIKRGENAGRNLAYYNVVTELRVLKTWNGAAPLTFSTEIAGSGQAVIIVQAAGHGRILAAAVAR